MRILITVLVAAGVAFGMLPPEVGRAQDAAYRLVADWPTLPPGPSSGSSAAGPTRPPAPPPRLGARPAAATSTSSTGASRR